jgi:hypothetical protein
MKLHKTESIGLCNNPSKPFACVLTSIALLSIMVESIDKSRSNSFTSREIVLTKLGYRTEHTSVSQRAMSKGLGMPRGMVQAEASGHRPSRIG